MASLRVLLGELERYIERYIERCVSFSLRRKHYASGLSRRREGRGVQLLFFVVLFFCCDRAEGVWVIVFVRPAFQWPFLFLFVLFWVKHRSWLEFLFLIFLFFQARRFSGGRTFVDHY